MDAEDLADIFAAFGRVSIRRMFGGQGVFADGLMFALVARDDLYLKVDDAFAAQLEAEGSAPFTYERRGEMVSLGYWSMPAAGLDDPEVAADYARAALAVARRADAAKPPARRKRTAITS